MLEKQIFLLTNFGSLMKDFVLKNEVLHYFLFHRKSTLGAR